MSSGTNRLWHRVHTGPERVAAGGFDAYWTHLGERTLVVFGFLDERLWSWHLRDEDDAVRARGSLVVCVDLSDALEQAVDAARGARLTRVARERNRALAPMVVSSSRLREIRSA